MPLGSTGAGGVSAVYAGMILLVEDDNPTSRLERFVLERAGDGRRRQQPNHIGAGVGR